MAQQQLKNMKKTIKQWFETLPEPYRTQALENFDCEFSKERYLKLYSALAMGFVWSESPQGADYWEEFADSISRKEENKTT